jgi:hypothetical protein
MTKARERESTRSAFIKEVTQSCQRQLSGMWEFLWPSLLPGHSGLPPASCSLKISASDKYLQLTRPSGESAAMMMATTMTGNIENVESSAIMEDAMESTKRVYVYPDGSIVRAKQNVVFVIPNSFRNLIEQMLK